MTRSAIEHSLYLMDAAFEGDSRTPTRNWHAFLVNLASIPREDWTWAPPNGNRTVVQFIEEVGGGKRVYQSQAFGDRSVHLETCPTFNHGAPTEDILAWLRESHQILRDSVAALDDDAELVRLRMSPQGVEQETRWIIKTTVEHDLYHSGEINHLRALRQGDDF